MKIGDVVQVAPSESVLDCCQGKRGRIAHVGVGGGFLLNTDHFCPIERTEEELTAIPLEVQAQEFLDSRPVWIVEDYEGQDTALLVEYAPRDKTAWAVLFLRGESIEA